MLEYYPNKLCPNLDCYDFYETCKIPSNCFHTQWTYGEYLPQNIVDEQQAFIETHPIRNKGRYVIITYILKRKNHEKRKIQSDPDEGNGKRRRGVPCDFSDGE